MLYCVYTITCFGHIQPSSGVCVVGFVSLHTSLSGDNVKYKSLKHKLDLVNINRIINEICVKYYFVYSSLMAVVGCSGCWVQCLSRISMSVQSCAVYCRWVLCVCAHARMWPTCVEEHYWNF
jgi:hypothetical protein